MENRYSTIYIVDVSQNPEEVETVTSRIVQLIEDHGGVIVLNNPWGKRRMAYPINNKNSGFYVEIEFTAQSRLNIPQIIEKEYRLNDRVMRHLTYVVTKEELLQRGIDIRRAKTSSGDDDFRGGRDDDRPRRSGPRFSNKDIEPIKRAEAVVTEKVAPKADVVVEKNESNDVDQNEVEVKDE